MLSWLKKFFSHKHSDSEGCGLFFGFVVTEHGSGRMVHRELMDARHLSIKRASRKSWYKLKRLEWRYNSNLYDVQDASFNSEKAFDHFYPDTVEEDSRP
jgi:hypothetical protein